MTPLPADELKAFFVELTGLAAAFIVWDDEEEPAIFDPGAGGPTAGTTAYGILRISELGGDQEGGDDLFDVADVDGNLERTTYGARTVSLSMRYDSYASPKLFRASDMLEKIRTRLDAGDKWHLRLRELTGCAVVSVGKTVRLPKVIDSRAKNCAALDLVLRRPQTDDATAEGDGIIEIIETNGTIDGPA